MKIILIEREKLCRDLLSLHLGGKSKVFCADDQHDANAFLDQHEIDLILISIVLVGVSTIVVNLKERCQKIIVYGSGVNINTKIAAALIRAGANGLLSKNVSINEFDEAITQVMLGRKYIEKNLNSLLFDTIMGKDGEDELSARENDVFLLLAGGMSLKEISSKLNISKSTAQTHKYRILSKFRLKTTAQLIYHAVKNGYV